MRQLSDARPGGPRIMATCVPARTPGQITWGVTVHKNIPPECNVTIWNFYDPEFFMYEMSRSPPLKGAVTNDFVSRERARYNLKIRRINQSPVRDARCSTQNPICCSNCARVSISLEKSWRFTKWRNNFKTPEWI